MTGDTVAMDQHPRSEHQTEARWEVAPARHTLQASRTSEANQNLEEPKQLLLLMRQMQSLQQRLAIYRDAAIGASARNPRVQNQHASRLHACYQLLSQSADGRHGIMLLLSDDDPHVRVWAAAHSLQWEPEKARRVLEELRDSNGPESFSAKWTLQEFDEDSLTFDY